MAVLLLERHPWETSGSGHQVQVPKAASARFFGTAGRLRSMADIFDPPTATNPARQQFLLSYYARSDTYRFNQILQFGHMGHAVVAIEETGEPLIPYNIWWFLGQDAMTILGRPLAWQQAKRSQHGMGRRWTIIPSPGPRTP